MTKTIEIHDIVCGQIQIAVNDIIQLTPKGKPKFYGVKGSNCMITVKADSTEDDEAYYFTKATIEEVQAITGEIKPKTKSTKKRAKQ